MELTLKSPKFSLAVFASESVAPSHRLPSLHGPLVSQAPRSAGPALYSQKSQSMPAFYCVSKSLNMPTKISKVRKAVYQPFIYLIAAINLF